MGVLGAVVDVIQHHVLDGHPALVGVGLRNIAAHRVEERLDVVLFVDRDDFVANGVVRRVQGDRQRNVDHIAEFIQRRHHAGGRQGHTTLGKAKAEIVEHDFHRRNDIVEVQQRLAHAHHYYVGNGTHAGGLHRADDLRRAPNLADNFGYPQVAVKALLGGGAEFALQRAAYLGGDAQGGAVFFRDIDGLDALIANGNRPFNGPVG